MTTPIAEPNGYQDAVQQGYAMFGHLDWDGVEVPVPKPEGSDRGDANSYSAFQHREARLSEGLYGVIMEADIDDPPAKLLMLKLFRAFQREWSAPLCNRDYHIARLTAQAEKHRARCGNEDLPDSDSEGNPLRAAGDLVLDWHRATSFLAEAVIQEQLHGLDHVRASLSRRFPGEDDHGNPVVRIETARDRLDEARAQLERVRYEATELPPEHHNYFRCSILALAMEISRNTDQELGIPVVDYTEVKAQLLDGVLVERVSDKLPWAYQEFYARARAAAPDGATFREYKATLATGQWPHDRRPLKPKQGVLERLLGQQEDGEEEEEPETDDRNAKQRRQEKGRQRNRRKK